VESRQATKEQIAGLRATKYRDTDPPIIPGFYAGLVEEAEPFLLYETPAGTRREDVLGYALLLRRKHEGHDHITLVELGLGEAHRDRYEDVLDHIREAARPTAYLVRTDDCRLNATLLARGLQVEATALIMAPEAGSAAAGAATTAPGTAALELAPLSPVHVPGVAELLEPGGSEPAQEAGHHHHGADPAEMLAEVRVMAEAGEGWVLLESGRPQAVVARLPVEKTDFELLDFLVAQGEETGLSWAFAQASQAVQAAGRRPAAVIDALDPVRRRIMRAAGYYTAAAYMVFYDPAAGRPSIPALSLEELRGMIARKESFHLVDVMGEDHWKAGHIPGAEWIDFRGLSREARKRYKEDETIVVYCNGFT
jgi:hypothetical protein